MAYEFKKIADTEVLTEVPETATVMVEVDGEIKRASGSQLGGGGGLSVWTMSWDSANYNYICSDDFSTLKKQYKKTGAILVRVIDNENQTVRFYLPNVYLDDNQELRVVHVNVGNFTCSFSSSGFSSASMPS